MSCEDDAWDTGYSAGKTDVRAEVVRDLDALISLVVEQMPTTRGFIHLVRQMRDAYREEG